MKFSEPHALQELFPEAASDVTVMISAITPPQKACCESLVVFFKPPTLEQSLLACQAAAWVVPTDSELPPGSPPTYFVERPRYELMLILRRYRALERPQELAQIDLSAIVHPDAVIGSGVTIGAYAVIAKGVYIDSGCTIGPHCILDERVSLAEGVSLHAHTHLYSDVHIGAHTTIHSHSVLGMPGFGFEFEQGSWEQIPHCGGVCVGQRCVIGSHVSIAAGVIEPTIVGDDVIMDNHIHLAHQVELKQGNAIAACVGIAGSTTIEPYCQIGGGSMISGHLTIGPQVQLTGMSMVNKSLTEPGRYSSGWPVEDNAQWRRKVASLNRLPEYLKKMRRQGAGHES